MPTKVRLYEIATATITASIDIKHVNYSIITVTAIAFSPDGKLLALLYCARNTQRTTIVLLDVSSLEIVSRFYIGRVKNVDGAIQFSPNSQLLAVLTQASGSAVQYQLYNVGSGDLVSQLRRKARYISALSISFSPNGDFAATVYDENLVGIVAVESGKLVKELKSRVNSSETTLADYVAFSPDGKVLAVRETERISTGRGDSIVLYECAGWTHLKSIDIPNGKGVRRSWNGKLSFSPDSRTLAVEVGYYGKNRVGIQMLDVWRGCINASYWAPSVESLPRWGLFRVHAFGFRALSFSADGEVLALAVVQSKPTGDDSQLASESWLLNRQEWKRLS
jgi:WD40 repeat protein